MTSQIALLKKYDAVSSNQLSKALRDSANTIAKLLKMNEHLQNELSQSVITWSSQTEDVKSKLISSDTRLKNAQKEVSKLRKACNQATQVKEHAIETAKAKVMQKTSVHHLTNKGVFLRRPVILFAFFSRLATQQATSMKLLLLYSKLQELPWLEVSAIHLLPGSFKRGILLLRFNLDMR